MSSAGHIFDMIARMKNNRMKHDERRNRQKKVMESLSDKGNLYNHLNYKSQTEQVNKQVASQIYREMAAKNRRALLIELSVLAVVTLAVCLWIIKLTS